MCLLSWKRLMQSRCGHPQNFKVISKFSQIRPVFPDYLSVSYDYALTNQDYDFFNHPGSYRNIMQFQMTYLRSFWEVLDSSALLAYASLAGLRTLLQRLLVCLNFPLESEHLSFWYNRKKWFLWTMATAQAAENHEDEWDLNWYFLWKIYASVATWTHPHNSLTAAEPTSLKISCHETSLKWSQRPSQSALEYI